MTDKAKIIDGKKLSEKILLDLRHKIKDMDRHPGLAAVLVGDDPASRLYVENKKKACLKVGIDFYDYFCGNKNHPNDTEEDIIKVIKYLNQDEKVDGIIIQLPIPKKYNTQKIIDALDPAKDVDGFHPQNKKEFTSGKFVITPPLIMAVNHALESTEKNLKNKKAVIVSKSPIFADPMKEDLERRGLRVEVVKPEGDFGKTTKTADVLIVIVGKPHLIKKEMVKNDAVIIDIGTTMTEDRKILGDVDPEVAEVASHVTPVPGGVGPLTVAMLLQGTYDLVKNK